MAAENLVSFPDVLGHTRSLPVTQPPVKSEVKIRFWFSRAVSPRTSGAFDREGGRSSPGQLLPVVVANCVQSVMFSNRLILSMDDNNNLWRELESLEDGECEADCSCAGCLLASTTHDNPPPPPEEPDEPHPPIQLEQTRHKKAALQLDASVEGQDILSKVLRILDAIDKEQMTLSLFLDALSWGDKGCTTNDRVCYARAGLLVSEELPNILAHWYKPPRNKNKGPRAADACQAMQTFAIDCVLQQLEPPPRT